MLFLILGAKHKRQGGNKYLGSASPYVEVKFFAFGDSECRQKPSKTYLTLPLPLIIPTVLKAGRQSLT
jgi:hypothetical protein